MRLLCCVLAIVLAAGSFGDHPVKTTQTLTTPEMAAGYRESASLRGLALKGDGRPFCAAVGHGPAEDWVNKPDEWFWAVMPSTELMRTHTIGNDPFGNPKLGCPVHAQQIYGVNAYYPWIVDPVNLPCKIKCPIGGEVYPSNDFAAGDMTTGPYADDGSGCLIDGKRYYFIGLYSHYAYNTVLHPAIKSFGHAYLATGDGHYAHKAAVCLLKEAFEYPNSSDRRNRTYIPGYAAGSGMITDVVWSSGLLVDSAHCYDEVFDAIEGDEELVAFAHERIPEIQTAADVRVYIEDKLFRPGIQAIIDKRIQPNTGWAQECMANLALLLTDFGRAGEPVKRPNSSDCLEWLYYGAGRLMTAGNQFYKDGGSYESTGYNDARAGFIRAADLLARLREFSGDRMDAKRYPDIGQNEKMLRYEDTYKQAIRVLGGAQTICVGDIGAPAIAAAPATGSDIRPSEYLDGYGLGILRSGEGTQQRAATVFYGGVRGHAHYDPLFFDMYGVGRDLLPNIGYPQSWNYASAWEWSLLTHNTVVVDRDEKPCSTVLGSLLVWSVDDDCQVMEAAKRPYRRNEPRGEAGPDVTDYRRMVALIDIGPEQWYAVDIFRVAGGRDHLQSWHGGYTPTPVTIEGATLTAQEKGTLAGEDAEYGQRYTDASGRQRWDPYCHLHTVARGPMSPVTSVDFDYNTADALHVRLSFVPMGESELITALGGAPIAPEQQVLQWALPHREGEEGLRSQFVTIAEAYTGGRFLGEIERLPVHAVGVADYEPIALAVTVPGGRDIILANYSESGRLEGDGFSLTGKFGLIRERDGRPVTLKLVAGSELTCGQMQVVRPAAGPSGGRPAIVAVDRESRTITIQGPNMPSDLVAGHRVIIDNHGERLCSYTVTDAKQPAPDRLVLTLDSSGNIGEGFAAGFEDGVILNGPEVNMPFAGLVEIDGRLDYSDCYYYGGHLETGKPGVDLKVLGAMGFPYQAWGNLHIAGINHVHLCEKLSATTLESLIEKDTYWTIYEYGVGDEVAFDHSVRLEAK